MGFFILYLYLQNLIQVRKLQNTSHTIVQHFGSRYKQFFLFYIICRNYAQQNLREGQFFIAIPINITQVLSKKQIFNGKSQKNAYCHAGSFVIK